MIIDKIRNYATAGTAKSFKKIVYVTGEEE